MQLVRKVSLMLRPAATCFLLQPHDCFMRDASIVRLPRSTPAASGNSSALEDLEESRGDLTFSESFALMAFRTALIDQSCKQLARRLKQQLRGLGLLSALVEEASHILNSLAVQATPRASGSNRLAIAFNGVLPSHGVHLATLAGKLRKASLTDSAALHFDSSTCLRERRLLCRHAGGTCRGAVPGHSWCRHR